MVNYFDFVWFMSGIIPRDWLKCSRRGLAVTGSLHNNAVVSVKALITERDVNRLFGAEVDLKKGERLNAMFRVKQLK